ncbi:MAG: SGNH/GDSL hydrolase family protein, partial [Victivallaceae bacterium]|nr:SGNH/GDSL hydrolase family protein [Victivallaceae bacterium]
FDMSGDVSPLPKRLPRFRAKLTEPGATVRIGWLGDSISEGYNASGYIGVSPFQPPFAELTAREIGGHFRVAAELFNHGHNGARTAYPLQNQEIWCEDKPDLLVVAFGMNDFASPAGVDGYLANLAVILRIAHSCSANTEVLLLASMCGNPAWKNTPLETAAVFSQALRKFATDQGDAVGFVDLFALWSWFLRRKNFLDLTGNGVNHPNDFGHRALACGVCSTFVQEVISKVFNSAGRKKEVEGLF